MHIYIYIPISSYSIGVHSMSDSIAHNLTTAMDSERHNLKPLHHAPSSIWIHNTDDRGRSQASAQPEPKNNTNSEKRCRSTAQSTGQRGSLASPDAVGAGSSTLASPDECGAGSSTCECADMKNTKCGIHPQQLQWKPHGHNLSTDFGPTVVPRFISMHGMPYHIPFY